METGRFRSAQQALCVPSVIVCPEPRIGSFRCDGLIRRIIPMLAERTFSDAAVVFVHEFHRYSMLLAVACRYCFTAVMFDTFAPGRIRWRTLAFASAMLLAVTVVVFRAGLVEDDDFSSH